MPKIKPICVIILLRSEGVRITNLECRILKVVSVVQYSTYHDRHIIGLVGVRTLL